MTRQGTQIVLLGKNIPAPKGGIDYPIIRVPEPSNTEGLRKIIVKCCHANTHAELFSFHFGGLIWVVSASKLGINHHRALMHRDSDDELRRLYGQ